MEIHELKHMEVGHLVKMATDLKVNGAGYGYFEYRLAWPAGLETKKIAGASLVMEVSAKQLFGKDREDDVQEEGDFMLGKGTHDPSKLPMKQLRGSCRDGRSFAPPSLPL